MVGGSVGRWTVLLIKPAQARVNVYETMERKNNCKLNFFSLYFVQNNEEIHFSFKNSEKYWTQTSFKHVFHRPLSYTPV